MLNDIINYGVRVLIILVGILLTTGIFSTGDNNPMIRIIGVIAILFGLYRIIMYSRNKIKYKKPESKSKDTDTDKYYFDDFDTDKSDETNSNNSNDDN